ncbi:MAG TPA: ABC transporter substrate-binding protein [Solirubrobacteraceae bacterium]|jgi:peptide/nickel transport system substrate-binding protein|nr:ABC transporter substrate-binding protein [Solirubrobacteraceae bacterium]
MKRSIRTIALAALAGVFALALAACGSSSSSSSSSSGATPAGVLTPASESQSGGKKGGVLHVLNHEDFEHIDPGQSYFSIDYEADYATSRPLYSYKPNNFKEPVPDMASALPTISANKETITIPIRHGVHFGPPVNREVTSADVAYALDRGANPNVANPYFGAYFKSIVGEPKASGGPIPGITTPNKYTLVLHLSEPKAATVIGALVLPVSAAVPEEYAKKHDEKKPSEYGNYQVATGPYMWKANSEGKILGIGYQPGKSATLVRNPNWNASTDFRPAYLNEIDISIGGDTNVIGRQVLEGSGMVQNDTPAQAIVKLAYEKFRSQLEISPGAGDHYVAVNNKYGPFKNVNLRKAYWAALDRLAMDKARGGKLVSDVQTHFIYPEIPGFEQAGGYPGPKVDYNEHPEGDMAVAEKYMKLAGYPSGKYTGKETVQVVGSTGNPAPEDAEIANQALLQLGFKTKLNLVDQSVMYSKYCGVVSEKIDVCPNVGWLADFGDPEAVLSVPFNGNYIVNTGTNSNWGLVDVPKINKAMEAAELIVGKEARANAWAKIDRELVEEAVAVPWTFDKQPNIESKDVLGVGDVSNEGSWDYNYTSLK